MRECPDTPKVLGSGNRLSSVVRGTSSDERMIIGFLAWKRSEVGLAQRSARATPPDIGDRTLDDIACRIDDKAQATPTMKEAEAKGPDISTDAALAQARDFPLVHQRLNEHGLDCEARGDDRRIDADGTLFKFHSAHSLDATAIAPTARPGFRLAGSHCHRFVQECFLGLRLGRSHFSKRPLSQS